MPDVSINSRFNYTSCSTSIPVTSKCNYWHLYDTLENKPMGKATKIYPTFPSGERFRFHIPPLHVDPFSYICRCSFNQSLCLLATIAQLPSLYLTKIFPKFLLSLDRYRATCIFSLEVRKVSLKIRLF